MEIYIDLYFCKDGVLRVECLLNKKKVYVPLIDIQNAINEDQTYFLSLLLLNTHIQEGTTLAHMTIALEPWASLLTKYLHVDFKAYCKASKLSESQKQMFDIIQVNKSLSIGRDMVVSPDVKARSFLDYINQPRVPTDYLCTHINEDVSGYTKKTDSLSGLTGTSFAEIKNTPVCIMAQSLCQFYGGTSQLTVGSLQGFDYPNHLQSYALAKTTFKLEEILRAIYSNGLPDYAPTSIAEATDFRDFINERISEIKPSLSVVGNEGSAEDDEVDETMVLSDDDVDLNGEKIRELLTQIIGKSNIFLGKIEKSVMNEDIQRNLSC